MNIYYDITFQGFKELNAFIDCYDQEGNSDNNQVYDLGRARCFFCCNLSGRKRFKEGIIASNNSTDRYKVLLRRFIGVAIKVCEDCKQLTVKLASEKQKNE